MASATGAPIVWPNAGEVTKPAAAYAIAVSATARALVALVASLRETWVLFATLIGARLLHERLNARRRAGVAAVVAGVVALKAG